MNTGTHPRSRKRLVAYLLTILVAACALGSTALSARAEGIVVLLPPKGAVGREFSPMMAVFEQRGIDVDVVAESLGAYVFWEETPEGRFSGTVGGQTYSWEITMTYGDVELDNYDVFIIGPGYAHTTWLGASRDIGKVLIEEAFERAMPVGGVSWGATLLVVDGHMDGRTTAKAPFYEGVIYPLNHLNDFLSQYDAILGTECVYIDRVGPGVSPVVTASYHCVPAFAETIIDEFLSD